ncbi:MAG: MBOAT family O-acyltransferase, partial [Candidatus Hinthialibacter sp.]
YLGGLVIASSTGPDSRRYAALAASVAVSLSLLGFFKYFMFFQGNVNWILEHLGAGGLPIVQIILPVGISFFIFQSISYTVDVYRGDAPPVRSFWDFACFVALFPQLIAGPIVRYNTVADQLVSRSHNLDKFASGAALFILGFAKKLFLANLIGKPADAVFAAQAPAALDAWFGVTAYAFQIYFDFSAYSDMAIGLGRMVGFEFPRNFNAPYHADSITDFWRRWHISLSTFLRDYLYIPLGGNRLGPRRTYINLALVMLLGGLWHGASWVFVIWGAYHGVLLAFERWRGKKSVYEKLPHILRVFITFVLVLFSWVLFRCPTLEGAVQFFKAMFSFSGAGGGSILLAGELYTRGNIFLMILCAVFAYQSTQAFDWVKRLTWAKTALLMILFTFSLMAMFAQTFNPFLYFQF